MKKKRKGKAQHRVITEYNKRYNFIKLLRVLNSLSYKTDIAIKLLEK